MHLNHATNTYKEMKRKTCNFSDVDFFIELTISIYGLLDVKNICCYLLFA
jgi:hypothetical protein